MSLSETKKYGINSKLHHKHCSKFDKQFIKTRPALKNRSYFLSLAWHCKATGLLLICTGKLFTQASACRWTCVYFGVDSYTFLIVYLISRSVLQLVQPMDYFDWTGQSIFEYTSSTGQLRMQTEKSVNACPSKPNEILYCWCVIENCSLMYTHAIEHLIRHVENSFTSVLLGIRYLTIDKVFLTIDYANYKKYSMQVDQKINDSLVILNIRIGILFQHVNERL